MSKQIPDRPMTGGRPRPANLAVLMRDVFVLLNDRVLVRLAERGHGVVRPVHSAVFEHLDDAGTTVTVLAERATMTKQAMAELVTHLEAHGYVTREPDPADRRAKLVRPTALGREVVGIAQELVPELEAWAADLIGADRSAALRADLRTLRAALRDLRDTSRRPASDPAAGGGSGLSHRAAGGD